MASQLVPLFHCPVCPPSSPLVAPVTLFCGHSVCASHVLDPLQSPSSPRLLRLSPCPLSSCTVSPSDAAPLPNIPSSSRVTFYPASGFLLDRDAVTFATIPESRTDVAINKLASIVHRYDQRAQSIEPLPTLDSGSGSDSETDDDEIVNITTTQPSPSQPGVSTPGSTSIVPSDVSSSSSIPTQIASSLDASLQQQAPARPNARKRRRKHLPPPRRLDSPAQSADHFEKELLAELSCEICFMLLYQPITSPCQHTFCSRCLYRSLDHGRQCPLCRQLLPGVMYFQDRPFNKIILSIILTAFPEAYTERGRLIEQEERHARLDTPIFVCQLSFPGLPTILHFFEPRYRLMLRRCLEKPNPCFGMIMPPSAASGRSAGHDFGTMLDIKKVRMLPDGRSMVETQGTYRFRIMERGSIDGYMVSRIERVFDCPSLYSDVPNVPDDAPPIPPPVPQVDLEADVPNPASVTTPPPTSSEPGPPSSYAQEVRELVDVCLVFLDQVQRGGAPWVVQRLNRLNHIYGPMPTDPSYFSYWMAMALPIEETEKAKLLPVKSPLLRLRLVVHWIEQLNSNWFVR
ncbi:LON-domain-containing protein [Lactarius vividus]|nr:LON-domain-containing protein [Lactarius vividus]